jgi:hypothetical protein
MGYRRQQFRVEQKRVRHARVPLCQVHCIDCQRVLVVTHVFHRFGDRCRDCWSADVGSVLGNGFVGGKRIWIDAVV